ncbi:hypothetical protein [Streptomyces sp. NBC_01727]|uniref:hypothetical protein n=1 Tax=Streptomyces sp. NBC_01727 TaxID=2975924 RepID=UPI002E0F6487|nr:hypothetical protein OIE76_44085 [Streptomyces sp. NBC_01727]
MDGADLLAGQDAVVVGVGSDQGVAVPLWFEPHHQIVSDNVDGGRIHVHHGGCHMYQAAHLVVLSQIGWGISGGFSWGAPVHVFQLWTCGVFNF